MVESARGPKLPGTLSYHVVRQSQNDVGQCHGNERGVDRQEIPDS